MNIISPQEAEVRMLQRQLREEQDQHDKDIAALQDKYDRAKQTHDEESSWLYAEVRKLRDQLEQS